MLQQIRGILRNRKGFTLIELMVVVVILGILASIAVQTFANTTDRANESKAKADVRTIMSALEIYRADVGSYPDGTAGLNALVHDSSSGSTDDSVTTDNIANWNGPYLKKVPTGTYSYSYSSTNKTYTVTCTDVTPNVTSNNL